MAGKQMPPWMNKAQNLEPMPAGSYKPAKKKKAKKATRKMK